MAQTATNPKIEELRFRLKTDPKSRLFYQLAEELRKAGHAGEAEQVLRSGLAVYPTYLAAWVSLGRVLREQKNDHGAVEALTKAMQLDPGNVVAARLLADAYRSLGDNVEAIKKYKLVHALMPADEELKATIEQLDREISGTPALAPMVAEAPPPPPPSGEDAAETPVFASDTEASTAPPPFGGEDAAGPAFASDTEASAPSPVFGAEDVAGSALAIDTEASAPSPLFGGEDAATPAAEMAVFPGGTDAPAPSPLFGDEDAAESAFAIGSEASAPSPLFGGEASDTEASAPSPLFASEAVAATAPLPSGTEAPPPLAEDSPFDRTVPPFEEAIATGDVEPMLAAHDDSPFEEPATLAAAIAIEQPLGMHVDVAPLVAELPAPVVDDEDADIFEPAAPEPVPHVEDLTNTLTMADLYARQGLTNDARHIYENILARDPGNLEVRAKLEALTPRVNPKIERLERWLAKVSRREVGRV